MACFEATGTAPNYAPARLRQPGFEILSAETDTAPWAGRRPTSSSPAWSAILSKHVTYDFARLMGRHPVSCSRPSGQVMIDHVNRAFSPEGRPLSVAWKPGRAPASRRARLVTPGFFSPAAQGAPRAREMRRFFLDRITSRMATQNPSGPRAPVSPVREVVTQLASVVLERRAAGAAAKAQSSCSTTISPDGIRGAGAARRFRPQMRLRGRVRISMAARASAGSPALTWPPPRSIRCSMRPSGRTSVAMCPSEPVE